jgi:hypothetical protein
MHLVMDGVECRDPLRSASTVPAAWPVSEMSMPIKRLLGNAVALGSQHGLSRSQCQPRRFQHEALLQAQRPGKDDVDQSRVVHSAAVLGHKCLEFWVGGVPHAATGAETSKICLPPMRADRCIGPARPCWLDRAPVVSQAARSGGRAKVS